MNVNIKNTDFKGTTIIAETVKNSTIKTVISENGNDESADKISLEIRQLRRDLGDSVPEIQSALEDIQEMLKKKDNSGIKDRIKSLSQGAINILGKFAGKTLKEFLGIE